MYLDLHPQDGPDTPARASTCGDENIDEIAAGSPSPIQPAAPSFSDPQGSLSAPHPSTRRFRFFRILGDD
ncbi:hypothetical protein [Luteolibacter luteus]|uniref:Uncharacterized protein n=1 Tax=Luteolibacter luteus TaxID=2728835 RepID=A0A858RRE8_9BACT|nr:hypothetical protein [Luteolibacter luteus]QJE98710.1 hypothetical protein HHL09_23975 [Luteolibacter luteus]